MCGHHTHRHTWAEIIALYRLAGSPVAPNDFIPRYNLAPTQQGPASGKETASVNSACCDEG
jgi:hypothetical protein